MQRSSLNKISSTPSWLVSNVSGHETEPSSLNLSTSAYTTPTSPSNIVAPTQDTGSGIDVPSQTGPASSFNYTDTQNPRGGGDLNNSSRNFSSPVSTSSYINDQSNTHEPGSYKPSSLGVPISYYNKSKNNNNNNNNNSDSGNVNDRFQLSSISDQFLSDGPFSLPSTLPGGLSSRNNHLNDPANFMNMEDDLLHGGAENHSGLKSSNSYRPTNNNNNNNNVNPSTLSPSMKLRRSVDSSMPFHNRPSTSVSSLGHSSFMLDSSSTVDSCSLDSSSSDADDKNYYDDTMSYDSDDISTLRDGSGGSVVNNVSIFKNRIRPKRSIRDGSFLNFSSPSTPNSRRGSFLSKSPGSDVKGFLNDANITSLAAANTKFLEMNMGNTSTIANMEKLPPSTPTINIMPVTYPLPEPTGKGMFVNTSLANNIYNTLSGVDKAKARRKSFSAVTDTYSPYPSPHGLHHVSAANTPGNNSAGGGPIRRFVAANRKTLKPQNKAFLRLNKELQAEFTPLDYEVKHEASITQAFRDEGIKQRQESRLKKVPPPMEEGDENGEIFRFDNNGSSYSSSEFTEDNKDPHARLEVNSYLGVYDSNGWDDKSLDPMKSYSFDANKLKRKVAVTNGMGEHPVTQTATMKRRAVSPGLSSPVLSASPVMSKLNNQQVRDTSDDFQKLKLNR